MEYIISHSAKGHTWKHHKYVDKIGNRYVYKDDQQRRRQRMSANYKGDKNKLNYLSNQQALADLDRPLTAKIQKNGLQLWDNIVNALTPVYLKEKEAAREALTTAIDDYEIQKRLESRAPAPIDKTVEKQRRNQISNNYKKEVAKNTVKNTLDTLASKTKYLSEKNTLDTLASKNKYSSKKNTKTWTKNTESKQKKAASKQKKAARSTDFRYRITYKKDKT